MPVKIFIPGSFIDDPYLQSIATMAAVEFPGSRPQDPCAVFEAVVKEVVGTKQHRYGPTPDPERLVAIREVVRDAVAQDRPIPILMPWGASKQGPWKVDIAEVMALKQLNSLASRVVQHYSPGIDIRIRLEDLTDKHMFADVPGWANKTNEYVDSFRSLHQVLSTGYSAVRLESELMDTEDFYRKAHMAGGILNKSFEVEESKRRAFLKAHIPTWSGDLPDNQLNFYKQAYSKFYPDEGEEQKNARLATYFGGAISRFMLKGTGADGLWEGKYITLSLTGIPWGKAGRRIFYRTIPERYTNQHRAPWIGKGYVRIAGNEATPAIAGWNGDGLEYVPATLVFQGNGAQVGVSADYVVVE